MKVIDRVQQATADTMGLSVRVVRGHPRAPVVSNVDLARTLVALYLYHYRGMDVKDIRRELGLRQSYLLKTIDRSMRTLTNRRPWYVATHLQKIAQAMET